MAARQIVLTVGKLLVALAFLSAIAVGIIAVVEGENVPMSHSAAGRPAMFLPIAYVPILVAGVVVGAIFVVKKFLRRRRDHLEK